MCLQEQLKLSPEQRSALAATRRAMLANVGALLAERKQLVARAKVCLQPITLHSK